VRTVAAEGPDEGASGVINQGPTIACDANRPGPGSRQVPVGGRISRNLPHDRHRQNPKRLCLMVEQDTRPQPRSVGPDDLAC
jgi:hypothetical protein